LLKYSLTNFDIDLHLRRVLFVCKTVRRHRFILAVVFFLFQVYSTTQSVFGSENVRKTQQSSEVQHKFQLDNRAAGLRFEEGIEYGVPAVHDQATAVGHHQSEQPVITGQPDGGQRPASPVQLSACGRRHTVETVQFAQTRTIHDV